LKTAVLSGNDSRTWGRLDQYSVFDMQVARFVLNVRSSRANANQPGSLELTGTNGLHDSPLEETVSSELVSVKIPC
jgi:hypothetical protein